MIGVTLDNAAGGKNILIEKNHYPPLPGAGIGGDPDGAEKVADVIDIFFARTLHCAGKNDRLWAGKNQGGEIRHLLNRICPMRDDRAGDVLAFERLPNFLGKAQPDCRVHVRACPVAEIVCFNFNIAVKCGQGAEQMIPAFRLHNCTGGAVKAAHNCPAGCENNHFTFAHLDLSLPRSLIMSRDITPI